MSKAANQGVPAASQPSLSHPSGAEPVPVSGKAGIANAEYSTFVLFHPTREEATAAFSTMIGLFPFSDGEVGGTRITAWSAGDTASVCDAVRMALECRALDQSERAELALHLIEHVSWEDCLRTFEEWELLVEDGALKDARNAESAQ